MATLERDLPAVTLLYGPPGAGKTTLVEHLIEAHQVHPADVLRSPDPLHVDDARAVVTFLATAALGGFKLVHIHLDGASPSALNSLLKTLEEPPGDARFLLTATRRPLPTIVSRALVYRLGPRPVPGPPAASVTDAARATVLTLTRAVATGDTDLFNRAVSGVDQATRHLLLRLLTETLTGRWNAFTAADAFGLGQNPTRVRDMIAALHNLGNARPRLNVATALAPFVH